MFDFHVHTAYSSDCQIPLREMIEGAIRNGVQHLAITDHIDREYNGDGIEFEFDLQEQAADIEKCKTLFKNQLKIYKGLELGVQPHILETCSEIVKNADLDFVIASLHNANRQDLYNGDFYKDITAEEAVRRYFSDVEYIVEHFDDFSVVGHLDIFKRYNEAVRALKPQSYLPIAEKSLKRIIQKEKGIEINASGIRQGLGESLPSESLLTCYYELGGRIITFGSDAHMANDIGHSYDSVKTLIRKIGFKGFYIFDKMEAIECKLNQ